jgi:CheY-like chemotaxis protein
MMRFTAAAAVPKFPRRGFGLCISTERELMPLTGSNCLEPVEPLEGYVLNELLNAMMMAERPFDNATTFMGPPCFASCQARQIAATRILHVDDEPDMRDVVTLLLGQQPDFATRSCGSGKDALAIAADWKPDLILLDLMMPHMGGVTTLARLRIDQRSRMPVVFLTGCRMAQETQYFRSLGAAGVIFKPFEPVTLAASVRSYLRH